MQISEDSPLFTVLLTLPCEPTELAPELEKYIDFISTRMTQVPGFVAAAVFASEDRTHVVGQFQWKDRESYEAYRRSETGGASVEMLRERHPKTSFLILKRTFDARQ